MLNQLIDPDEQKAVLEGEILTTAYLKNHEIFSNQPQSNFIETAKLPGGDTTDYSMYEMLSVEKAFIPFDLDSENFLQLFNSLTAYTRLAGIRYYSRTDKKLQPYILSSHRIKSPQNLATVEDEKHTAIPTEYTAYFVIEDNRFGKLRMQSNILTQNKNITIRNRTIEPMSKLLIPINKPGEYEQQVFLFYDNNSKGFFYYSMQAMRIRSGFFLKLSQLTADNFANRSRALTVYFAGLFGHDWKHRLVPEL